LDSVWTGEAPCGKPTLDARYMPKVPDHAQFEEMFFLCPFWDIAGPCGMQTSLDGKPCEDHGHNQFVGAKECKTGTHNIGAYEIL